MQLNAVFRSNSRPNLDWETAVYAEDTRFPYPERRFVALGYAEARLYVVCFTPDRGRHPHHQSSQGKPSRGETL